MPSLLSRLKGKDGLSKSKSKKNTFSSLDSQPQKPRWEDAWARTSVEAEEVVELLSRCGEELKSRALHLPFLLLPFRPRSDPSAVRTFVRHYFDGTQSMRGETLVQELRMTEPIVVAGVTKWCWARLQGGVVGWDAYELFKVGEQDSNMARDSFRTFIPLSVDSDSRARIIIDFFDLLSAIAAHGRDNGLGGRKLSRLAAWWAFESKDTGSGFEGGYKTWLSAADATSHLFFAYLRSLAWQPSRTGVGISMLPMSLQKLLQETEYPPQRPSLMQSSTNKVVMIVDTVSPTPFALLRRANHFQYRDDDRALREYSEYEDPVQALTEECRRVLKSISTANQSQVSSTKHSTSLRDASWSRFEDIGFGSAIEEDEDDEDGHVAAAQRRAHGGGLRTTAASGGGMGLGRPTTPSWADFLSSGFVDDQPSNPSNMLLAPDKFLPPIETAVRQRSSQSHRPRLEAERRLEPGELASITRFDLDDAFWWVWMSSLSPEETAERKSAFGRCAVIETVIKTGRWLVVEEMVKGAAPEPDPGAYIAEKKSFFSWTRRGKGLGRRKSTGKNALDKGSVSSADARSGGGLKAGSAMGTSKTSIGPDQHARIQAAAQQLQARQAREWKMSNQAPTPGPLREPRRRDEEGMSEKTSSIFTLQPLIISEATSAIQWANKYDKDAIREAYLANNNAGRGIAASTMQTNGDGYGNGNGNGYHPGPSASNVELNRPRLIGPSKSQLSFQPTAGPSATVPSLISPVPPPHDDEPRYSEKAVEAPRELHPAERPPVAAGRSSPLPPPKELPRPAPSAEIPRDAMLSPEPAEGSSPEGKRAVKKLQKEVREKPTRAEAAAPIAAQASGSSSGGGGFRKLFGRKNRISKLPDNAAADVNGMLAQRDAAPTPEPAGSTFHEHDPPMVVSSPEPDADPEPSPIAAAAPPRPAESSRIPIRSAAPAPEGLGVRGEPAFDPRAADDDAGSRVDPDDALEAQTEFARFDQGPLLDQPAFITDDGGGALDHDDGVSSVADSDDATPPPIARRKEPVPAAHASQQLDDISDNEVDAAAAPAPVVPKVAATPPTPTPRALAPQQAAPPAPVSAPTGKVPRGPPAAQSAVAALLEDGGAKPPADRWAQIRKNAAERAAQRQPDERPPRGAGMPPQKPLDGDDDTSGEETIESRVARIKARVAELTGTMEGVQGPGNRAPPVRR